MKKFPKVISNLLLVAFPFCANAMISNNPISVGMGNTGVAYKDYNQVSNNVALSAFGLKGAFISISGGFTENNYIPLKKQLSRTRNKKNQLKNKVSSLKSYPTYFDFSNQELINVSRSATDFIYNLKKLDHQHVSGNGNLNLNIAMNISRNLSLTTGFDSQAIAYGYTKYDKNDSLRVASMVALRKFDSTNLKSFGDGTVGVISNVFVAPVFKFNSDYIGEVAVGLKAKLQRLDSYSHKAYGYEYDRGLLNNPSYKTYKVGGNFDLDFIAKYSSFTFGFTGENLLKNKIKTAQGSFLTTRQIYEIGASYEYSNNLFELDYDLNNAQPLKGTNAKHILSYEQQWLKLGWEFTDRFLTVRCGYDHDIKGHYADNISIGLGVKLFDKLSLNGAFERNMDNGNGFSIGMNFNM